MSTTTKWVVDPTHSEVQFKVKHLVISTVTGAFKTFSGEAFTDGSDFENARINFMLDVKSVDTNQAQRDEHLRSGDFFEAESYPQIEFKSTSFTRVSDDNYKLIGDLTMKGVTKA